MGKRGNGEGTIIKNSKGYWEARVMIGRNEMGKPKYKTFSNKLRSVVVDRLSEYRLNRKDASEQVCTFTTGQWLNKWYNEYVISNVKLSTRSSYEMIINRHLKPYIGHIKLVDLKKADIEEMYRKLITSGRVRGVGGLSVKSVRNIALVLHKALDEAMKREYIIKNPASIANVPTMRSENVSKKEIEILTKEEQKRLMAACENDVYGVGIITVLYTGLRLGELLGLQWSDINFEEKTIEINKQVNRLKDYSEEAKAKTRLGIQHNTKTRTSCRKIAIDDVSLKRLIVYKAMQDEQRKLWGSKYKNLGMVFARDDGSYMDPTSFRKKYQKMLNQVGLKKFTVHALRHTFATRALEAGIPIKVVSQILGHASVQITMDTYSHVLPEYQSEAMSKIADYYEQIAQ